MFWKILGIEPTKNKKEITNAYREKLMDTNPEDKPEEFKALREAYEMALEYASSESVIKTPIELWKDKLTDIYNNFKKRIDVKEWESLCNEMIAVSFDTKGQTEEALLKFFMDNYLLSQKVWIYLESHYHFLDHLDELYEAYPREFIDYVVVNGINNDVLLPLELFEPGINGEECAKYLNIYREASRSDKEQAKALYAQLMELEESHPLGEARYYSSLILDKDYSKLNDLEQLVIKNNYDSRLVSLYASLLVNETHEYEKAEKVCEEALKRDETNDLRTVYASALAGQEKYKDAIDQLNNQIEKLGGNIELLQRISDIRSEYATKWIDILKKDIEEHPENVMSRRDLAWSLLQCQRMEEAVEVAKDIHKGDVDDFDYYNLNGSLSYSVNDMAKAIEYIDPLIDVIKHLEDDGTEKTQRRIRRLGEMVSRKASALFVLERYDEAIECFEQAYEINPTDNFILSQLSNACGYLHRYEDSIKWANKIIENEPFAHYAFILLAKAYLHLDYDRDAFDAINKALELNESELESYFIKAYILVRNNALDGAKDLIQFLDDNGINDEAQVHYINGRILELEEGKTEDILNLYDKAIKGIENGQYMINPGEAYFRYSYTLSDTLDLQKMENTDKIIEFIDKGLEKEKDYPNLLDYKGWILIRQNKYDEALKIYQQLEKLEFHPISVERQIGIIYYHDLETKADKSLEYQLKVLAQKDDPECIFKAGMCEFYMGKYEDAIKHFEKLQEFDWNLDYHFRVSGVYADLEDLDKAIYHANEAVKIAKTKEGNYTKFYNNLIELLCRKKQYDEALDFIYSLKKVENYKGDLDLRLFDVYLLSGQYDVLERQIKNWSKEGYKQIARKDKLAELYMNKNDFAKAKRILSHNKKNIKEEYFVDKAAHIAMYEEKFNEAIDFLLRKHEIMEEKGYGDFSLVELDLSFCYFMLNDTEKQHHYASSALEYLNDRIAEPYNRDKTLYYARKVKALALLGKDYTESLEAAKHTHKCDNCKYHRCSDAEEYELHALFINKEYMKALELAQTILENWHDEYRVHMIIKYITKRIK